MPRLVTLSALAVAAVLALGACEPDEPEVDPDDDEDTEEADVDEPTDGGRLVAALSADPDHLNPALTTSGATHFASELMYNGLVELDEDLEPVGELAEDWEIDDDGATYTFTLRDDVEWHDGEPFTSEDVRFTFEEALLEFHARTQASMGDVLEEIETPDEHTVVFRFSEPYGPLLQQLNVTEAPIIPEHVFGDADDLLEHEANDAPVGTGPFEFVSYEPDSEVVLERNDDYFKEDLPHLDEVVLQVIPDEGSRVVAFEAGDVDFLWDVPGADLERLQETGDAEFLETNRGPGGDNCVMSMPFNLDNPVFADEQMRRAIGHAMDRDDFIDTVTFGQGWAAEAPIHRGIEWAHAEDVDLPEHDPERAEELLEEAGWVEDDDGTRVAEGVEGVEDGEPLEFRFHAFPTFSEYGELLRTQLAEVGIELSLQPLEPPSFVEALFTERDFDTAIISYCNGLDPEIGVRRMYDSDQIGDTPFSNAAAYTNEEVDQLFDDARAAVDLDERGELYGEIQQIVADELPYLWVVESESTRVHRPECSGIQPYGLFAEEARCEQ